MGNVWLEIMYSHFNSLNSHEECLIVWELMLLHQKHTVEAYVKEFDEVYNRVSSQVTRLDESFFIACFIAGLKDQIRTTFTGMNPQNLLVVKIQATLMDVTESLKKMKEEEEKRKQVKASITIQKYWRAYLVSTQFKKIKRVTVIIQQAWKKRKIQKRQQAFKEEQKTQIVLQGIKKEEYDIQVEEQKQKILQLLQQDKKTIWESWKADFLLMQQHMAARSSYSFGALLFEQKQHDRSPQSNYDYISLEGQHAYYGLFVWVPLHTWRDVKFYGKVAAMGCLLSLLLMGSSIVTIHSSVLGAYAL